MKCDFTSYMKKPLDSADYYESLKKIENDFYNSGQMKGWYNLDTSCVESVNETADYVRKNASLFVVIGIGGSYLGAKAVIDALSPYFNRQGPEILFVGNDLSSTYLAELIDYLHDKEVIVNVISKSGNTIEPNVAFEAIYNFLETKYDKNSLQNRIIVTTDKDEGYLLDFAKQLNCKRFVIPNDIGGRFSVLTPVGLLPIAVAGIDISKLFDGAKKCRDNLYMSKQYAIMRDIYYNMGKHIESFVVYEKKLTYFSEWLKQLFAESQGKNTKGILPTSMLYTRDLHSLGQYFQDGLDVMFETHIYIEEHPKIYSAKYHHDMNDIEKKALFSVCEAHYESDTPSIIITLDKLDEENIGYLIFFFFYSAMLGSYMLGVNYYDQPGVNGYKDILNKKLEDNV